MIPLGWLGCTVVVQFQGPDTGGTGDTADPAGIVWILRGSDDDADGDGSSALHGDCDDLNADIHPDALDLCDGIDNDCDGVDGVPRTLWEDGDGDGFGTGRPVVGCIGAFGVVWLEDSEGSSRRHALNDDDCDDLDPDTYPGAPEACDRVDNDCNGIPDDAPWGAARRYADADADGFGIGLGEDGCPRPGEPEALYTGDCDDTDPEVHPQALEVCDGIDNDCDSHVDRFSPEAPILYEDRDGDGLGNAATVVQDCDPSSAFTSTRFGDCDDNDPHVGRCAGWACGTTGELPWLGWIAFVPLGIRRRRSTGVRGESGRCRGEPSCDT